MLTVVKPVYYCEHCKRHRMTAQAILKHEPRCIYNPARSECGWHHGEAPVSPVGLTDRLKETLDLDWLRSETDCPACMLSVVVQAGLGMYERDDLGFRYVDEVDRYRKAERYADMRSTF